MKILRGVAHHLWKLIVYIFSIFNAIEVNSISCNVQTNSEITDTDSISGLIPFEFLEFLEISNIR